MEALPTLQGEEDPLLVDILPAVPNEADGGAPRLSSDMSEVRLAKGRTVAPMQIVQEGRDGPKAQVRRLR